MAATTATDYEAKLEDITQRGVTALRSGERKTNAAISDAADAGREVLDSAERVGDSIQSAILQSIKDRPYTTLAIAAAVGFMYGAFRR